MSLIWILRLLASLAYAVSANPLVGAENQLIGVSLPFNASYSYSSNRSLTPSDLPTENALNVKCDGAEYGANLDIADCKNAKSKLSSGMVQLPWVERDVQWHVPHCVLPFRLMGGKNQRTSQPKTVFY